MRLAIASLSIILVGASGLAHAQQPAQPARRSLFGRPAAAAPAAPRTPAAPPAAANAPVDKQVFRSGDVIPAPTPFEELEKPTIPLPTGPIEPFLLTKNQGPFMVLAYTFRGPDAVRYAQALCIELRGKGLPAYIFFLKMKPGNSNIRGVPPTAPDAIQSDENVTVPEKNRTWDEAAVLVGDCKTVDESEKVRYQVKHIHSNVIDGLPSIFKWKKQKGLSRATLTTNPLVPSQELFPQQGGGHHQDQIVQSGQTVDPSVLTASLMQTAKKPDPMLKRMNAGPHSVAQCQGRYTLQVADFLGRSTLDVGDQRMLNTNFLRQGPLAKAADDAESLAEALTKCKALDPKFRPFVYHDRTSSRVFLGSFSAPNDPALVALRGQLEAVSRELITRRFTTLPLAPATAVSEVPRL